MRREIWRTEDGMIRDDRLHEHASLDGECLIWRGTLTQKGYARVVRSGRVYRVHRMVWERANGPIPPGMQVMCLCDRRDCINIRHLSVGTNDQNVADMMRKQRQARGSKKKLAKLSEAVVPEIRRRHEAGETQATIAAAFGVSVRTIRSVVKRELWAHVP